jgi:hypothetical protein
VQQTVLVRVRQGVRQLGDDCGRFVGVGAARPNAQRATMARVAAAGFGRAARLLEQLGEARAFDELHGIPVQVLIAADVVDRHDAWMAQPGDRRRFASKSLDLARRERERIGEHLERDMALERSLASLVDDAHAAPAEFAQDLVFAELAPRRQRGLELALDHRLEQLAQRAVLFDVFGARLGLAQVGPVEVGLDRVAEPIEAFGAATRGRHRALTRGIGRHGSSGARGEKRARSLCGFSLEERS